jgi:hypothetical protein
MDPCVVTSIELANGVRADHEVATAAGIRWAPGRTPASRPASIELVGRDPAGPPVSLATAAAQHDAAKQVLYKLA